MTQKEIKKIENNITGKTRGITFITDCKYIRNKKGKKGIKKVQAQFKEWGVEVDYNTIKDNKWYPASWRIISLLAIKKALNWSDSEIIKMGVAAPKSSFVVRTLLRYFVSLERTFQETVKYWDKHWTVGELSAEKIDIKEKTLIIRIKNFKAHPVLCQFLRGYFKGLVELIVKDSQPAVEEVKCMSRGDNYHEFKIEW